MSDRRFCASHESRIPNIVSAGALRIGSVAWAKVGVPMGLLMLGIYFAVIKFLG
jgi:predicted cation transporter